MTTPVKTRVNALDITGPPLLLYKERAPHTTSIGDRTTYTRYHHQQNSQLTHLSAWIVSWDSSPEHPATAPSVNRSELNRGPTRARPPHPPQIPVGRLLVSTVPGATAALHEHTGPTDPLQPAATANSSPGWRSMKRQNARKTSQRCSAVNGKRRADKQLWTNWPRRSSTLKDPVEPGLAEAIKNNIRKYIYH